MPRFRLAALAALLPLLACAGPVTGAKSFRPRYQPSEEAPIALRSCAAPLALQVSDSRAQPAVVGRRFQEGRPSNEYPIQMEGDPVTYVQSALERAFARGGRPTGGVDAARFSVTLTQLNLEEKVFRNAEYDGQVTFEAALTLPGAKAPCWSGRIMGKGENYGSAGSPVNYEETLNRALDNAAARLFDQTDFNDALCGRCATQADAQAN
jgi:hypothetical protein